MAKAIGFSSEDEFRRMARVVQTNERSPRNVAKVRAPGPNTDEGRRVRLAQTKAVHPKGEWGTVEFLKGEKGEEAANGREVEAWNDFANLPLGARVFVAVTAGDWEIVSAATLATRWGVVQAPFDAWAEVTVELRKGTPPVGETTGFFILANADGIAMEGEGDVPGLLKPVDDYGEHGMLFQPLVCSPIPGPYSGPYSS